MVRCTCSATTLRPMRARGTRTCTERASRGSRAPRMRSGCATALRCPAPPPLSCIAARCVEPALPCACLAVHCRALPSAALRPRCPPFDLLVPFSPLRACVCAGVRPQHRPGPVQRLPAHRLVHRRLGHRQVRPEDRPHLPVVRRMRAARVRRARLARMAGAAASAAAAVLVLCLCLRL